MKKPYFTRKNLIVISLTFFFAFLMLFVGLCIEGSHGFAKASNPINQLAMLFRFKSIEAGVPGFLCLLMVAIYIIVCPAFIIYEYRYAVINFKNPKSFAMIRTYILTFIASFVIAFGVGILILSPKNWENVGNGLLFVWQSFVLTLIIYVGVAAFIGGILLFVVNFLLVDKPFRFFQEKDAPIIGDEEEHLDVTANFDEQPNINQMGDQSGVGGAGNGAGGAGGAGGSGDGSVVRKADELDDREKVFPGLSKLDEEFGGYAIEEIETDEITLVELAERFRNYLAAEEKLYFDIETIRYFLSGFATTPFMILEGLSGTGKSSLPRYFCKFTNSKLLFLPVQATWRDKTNLLGYFNDFSKTYTETEFLKTLYHGNYNPDMIHMYVLDEMNISRVEYYFADFLSVLEYPKEDWKLQIMQLPYNFLPPAKLENGVIQIAPNTYFIGTANKDDSTFTISDKVYDRAITIEFDDRNTPFKVEGEYTPINLSNSKLQGLYAEAKSDPQLQLTDEDFEKFTSITNFINEQFDITFGNRILKQITEIVPVYVACGGQKEEALDFLLSRKVISKVEGRFEEYVKGALKQLLALIHKTYGEGVLVRSEKTIRSLMRRL